MWSRLFRMGLIVGLTTSVFASDSFPPTYGTATRPSTSTEVGLSRNALTRHVPPAFFWLFQPTSDKTDNPAPTLTNSDGAMFCADRARSGRFNTAPLVNFQSSAWITSGTRISSTPIITDEGAFAVDGGNRRLLAFNLLDGSILWETPLGGSLSGAMISVDESAQIIILASEIQIAAYSTQSGQELWATPIQANVRSSPLISGGNVYVSLVDGTILALNQLTGQQAWSYPSGSSTFGSVALLGNTLYFCGNFISDRRGSVFALDASTGALIWQRNFSVLLRGTPVLAPGYLLINEGVTLLSALDPHTGETLWQTPASLNPVNGLVVVDSTIYLLERDGRIATFNITNGNLLSHSFGTNITSLSAPPVTAGDVLYLNENGGRLFAFRLSDLQRLWTFVPVGNGVSYQPAVHNGRVYVVDQPEGCLHALEGST